MNNFTVQIQSVIYHNDKKSLLKTIENIANAILVERKKIGRLKEVCLYYGDASDKPIFSEEEIEIIKNKYLNILDFKVNFFNFNSGTSKGHNILADNCEKDYLFLMNPDIIITPNFFIEIIKPFDDLNNKVGIVEARQTPIQHPKSFDYKTGETSWSSGACTFVPTRLFHEVGGYDAETFFLYCDDVDLSWRIRLKGYKIIFKPSIPVFHGKYLSVSGQWIPTSAEIYYSSEAALFMAYKWSNKKMLEKLLKIFETQTPESKKAVEVFKERQKNKKLPKQLDPEMKISTFVGYDYTTHQFKL